MKRIFINAETGEVKEIIPKNKKGLKLQEMYDLISCDLVKHVTLAEGVDLWIDEEGKLKDGAIQNKIATKYLHKAFPPETWIADGRPVDTVVGNAIIEDATDKWL